MSRRCGLRLGPREIRCLANGTQVETRQLPLPLLFDKHQRRAKLGLDAVAAIGSILDLTTDQDGGIVVHAHLDLVQGERFVRQVARLMSREPLLPGQHEAERSYTDEVIRKLPLKERNITTQFCGDPGVCKARHLLFSMFSVHYVTPFCRKLKVSSPQAIL